MLMGVSLSLFVCHALCVPTKTVLQMLHQLFSDVKFKMQFPLPQWSVYDDKSGEAAIFIHFQTPPPTSSNQECLKIHIA